MSFDYAFLSDNKDIVNQEGSETAREGAVKVLVVRGDKSKAATGHVVPSKEVDEDGFSVNCLVEDVKWLGYSKLILKSDDEPAILKLLTESLRELFPDPSETPADLVGDQACGQPD